MGWLKIDDVSKVYHVRASGVVDRDDDDEEDENDSSQDDWDAGKHAAESGRNRGNVDGDIWALRGVSLQVDEGEAIAVVGHTGSGKTTLLRIVAGLTPPTTGSVQGKGLVVPLSCLRAPIAANLTGRQNLALLEPLLGMERGRLVDRMTEIAAFAGMQRHINQKVSGYSSSMYGRLALAAGLVCDPDIVLVDESLPGGDPQFRLKVAERLQSLVKGGTTLLWASQKLAAFIQDLCPRCVWLVDGGIVADGPSEAVRSRYAGFENGPDPADVQDGAEDALPEIPDPADVQDGVEDALPEVGVSAASNGVRSDSLGLGERFLPEEGWLADINRAEERWRSFVEHRRRQSGAGRKRSAQIYPSQNGVLAKLVDMRLLDEEGGPANVILPGERVLVEIEVDVCKAGTEISVRVEFARHGTLLFESELGLPFRAEHTGHHVLSFPLEGWMMAQEVDKVLYKVKAQVSFRCSQANWEYTDFAQTRLYVLGSARRDFEVKLRKGTNAIAAPPTSVEEEIRESGPFLRVGLKWLICRVRDASDDQDASDGCNSEFEASRER